MDIRSKCQDRPVVSSAGCPIIRGLCMQDRQADEQHQDRQKHDQPSLYISLYISLFAAVTYLHPEVTCMLLLLSLTFRIYYIKKDHCCKAEHRTDIGKRTEND
jgi:hypothetical protein